MLSQSTSFSIVKFQDIVRNSFFCSINLNSKKISMLRKLLFVSLAVATLASCKKDKNDAPAYNLSAKIDGVSTAFNTAVVAQASGDAQTGYVVAIVAAGGSGSTVLPAFSLSIADEAAITAKAYPATNADGSYTDVTQNTYDSENDFTITVSSVTATDIKGTFSGKVKDDNGGIKTITEGTFAAKFQ